MKLTVSKVNFRDVLSKVQGLVSRKSNLAITSTVLIKAGDSGVTVEATDLETGFTGFYPAKVESTGIIAINAKKLYEIVRDFPSDDVQLHEVENYWIEIKDKNVEYHLVGMNPDDYPDIPEIDTTDFLEIESFAFKTMIERALLTGMFEDTRAHITGVFFEKIQNEGQKIIRMASTDGSRLSLADYYYEKEFENTPELNVMVPKKGLNEVSRFLDRDEIVYLGVKDNNLIIKMKSETFIIRLLEGEFPNYTDVISQEPAYQLDMDKHMFTMMLRRMSILSSEEYKGAIFRFSNNTLNINSTNPDIGESKEDMPIEYNDEPIEIMFNPKFFIETLAFIEDEIVIIKFTDETKPCLIKGKNDDTFLSVIMPMRI